MRRLVTPIAVLLCAGVTAAVTVAASSAGPAQAARAARSCTMILGQKDEGFTRIDNPPKGESAGDLFAITEKLLSTSGRQIGRGDISAVEPDPRAHIAEVTATFSLPHGQIDIQAAQHFHRTSLTAAIIGGTGAYSNARGSASLNGKTSRYVFHLIGTGC